MMRAPSFATRFRAAAALLRFGRDRTGAILAEFAMVFPIFVVLILGGYEIGRYVLLQQKLASVAVATADLVSQSETITATEVDNIFLAVDHIMVPFTLGDKGRVIVTSIGATGGQAPTVNWQRSGGGTGSGTSRLGAPGGAATLPAGFVVRDGESVIVSEVFYHFSPALALTLIPLPDADLYNEAFYRPRFGALTTLN
jgi:hypothetical protein